MAERRRLRIASLLGPLIGLVLVSAFFAVLEPDTFLSTYNLQTIAAQTVIVGLGAIGMTFVIVSAGIDLSPGSVIALASVVTALALRDGWSPSMSALAGVTSGAAFGLVNGALITGLRVVPFIVTLGTMGIARGMATWLAGEQKIDAPPHWLASVMEKTPSHAWLLVAPGTWIMFGLAIVAGFVLTRTVFGVQTYAIGSNESTARLCGVRVPRVKIVIYTLAGLFAGLAGVMQYARLTVGDPTTALGKELDIIAAVVIGGASLEGGVGGIGGSIIGAFLMSVLADGCTLTGVPNYVQQIVIGAIIVVAVAVDRVRSRRRV
jgi:ribose/xylose/arabinose/galactoside ABC-type transport system permease subunit